MEQNRSQARDWRDLLSHSAQLAAERREELEQDYKQLSSALPHHQMPDWETFLEVCGKILTNCFCLRSDRWEHFSVFQIFVYPGYFRKITIDSLHNILFNSHNFQRKGG